MVFKVGHREVKGSHSVRRGASWVLEIENATQLYDSGGSALLRTRRFSKGIMTFTLRFLYGPTGAFVLGLPGSFLPSQVALVTSRPLRSEAPVPGDVTEAPRVPGWLGFLDAGSCSGCVGRACRGPGSACRGRSPRLAGARSPCSLLLWCKASSRREAETGL